MSRSVCSFTVIGRGHLSWGLISSTWQTWLLLHPSWCHWPQWKWPKCPGLEHPRHKQSCVGCVGYFSYWEGKSGLWGTQSCSGFHTVSGQMWILSRGYLHLPNLLSSTPGCDLSCTYTDHLLWPATVVSMLLDANHATYFSFTFQQI